MNILLESRGAPWKCRAVENEENQNQVSLRFPPPLEIAARFPHSHRADDESLSAPTNPKKGAPNRAYLSSPLQAHSWIRKCSIVD
jgi:hypothetical protein